MLRQSQKARITVTFAKSIKKMREDKENKGNKGKDKKVYEIGYLLISSLPEEKVISEFEVLKNILSKKGADLIGEQAPELRPLSYTMIKKIGQSNQRFDKGYFGWFKFELEADSIEVVKKAFEENENMLRMLVINTVKENTYFGRKSQVAIPKHIENQTKSIIEPIPAPVAEIRPIIASNEEIDRSIDAMVKEA